MKLLSQKFPFIVLLAVLLASCVPSNAPSSRRSKVTSNVENGGTTTTPNNPVFNESDSLYWFSAEKVLSTITLNLNNENVIYLRGKDMHTFLTSKDAVGEYYRKQYCLIGDFGSGKQLRVRAVPIYISNYATKTIERMLRVDVPSEGENRAACAFSTIDSVPSGSAAYKLKDICPACAASGKITSTKMYLYESKATALPATLTQITNDKINILGMNIRVDLESNSSTPSSSCTNSACEAKGFDCCIEGQCVKDASLKANASLDPLYAQAQAEYAINPLSFLNYPNIYNICTNISHNPPPTPNTGPTPVSEAEKRVKDYFDDFSCINKHESNLGTSTCNATDYANAKKKLAIACGCPATYTDNERELKCPNWGVRPLYKNQTVQDPTLAANIADFYCYTPVPENPIGPITNLNLSVPSRSAPHRFYSATGTNYDDIGKLASTIKQEGEEFFYLDNTSKTGPVNGEYNINSVLGNMVVGLSQTNPAKMVAVELGKTYILSSVNGYFTPCSKCGKDSWFETFSAHPSIVGGSGLKAVGYSTARDAYSGNTTYGNYEDTKFGRACYVPVTMLAFSHKKESTLQAQRQNRLKTQAALYMNGYQRDWYGFNKGALIGSFDGVTWFAIGSSRRITATSTKLFIAVNGAFLDLADRTDTIVNIIPDQGNNTASNFDFDPQIAVNSPTQNTAASCQQYHQCNTDTDCVTKLGWEYTCADVSQLKSKWPIYDSDAKEVVNQERVGTIFEILQGTTNMGDNPKRCVFRGAGAPCVRDIGTLTNDFNLKNLTCAPNFYCASLSSSKFNTELVRSPNDIGNILFGMDANVLGRPLNYVTANKPLTSEIIANIKNSGTPDALNLTSAQINDMGVCRPGRRLSSNVVTAHSDQDTNRRTDYISQIGSCLSTGIGANRFNTCPVFGEDLNYVDPTNSNLTTLTKLQAQHTQNSCGGEAKNSSDESAFKAIEGLSLLNQQNFALPTLVADACFRRAGSVCHTDLDCGPNKMHAELADSKPLSFFGGTEAEQNYWKESLVCGQGAPVPAFGSADFFNYNMGQNRCCREIGKDFTMYTSGPKSIIPENTGSNETLSTSTFAVAQPNASNRYSRYSVSATANKATSTIPRVTALTEPNSNQWKVINETGTANCCGGGWVRKFADGTHDWKKRDRLTFDSSNLSCLNFRSPLVNADYNAFGDAADDINLNAYQEEFANFCRNHIFNSGCMQIPWPQQTGYEIKAPYIYQTTSQYTSEISIPAATLTDGRARLDTTPITDPIETNEINQKSYPDAPYPPEPYYFVGSGTFKPDLELPANQSYNFFTNIADDYGASMYLPAYIPFDLTEWLAGTNTYNIKVWVRYFYDNGYTDAYEATPVFNNAACNSIIDFTSTTGQPVDALKPFATGGGTNEAFCITSTAKTSFRPVISVKAYTGAAGTRQWKYAGVVIEYRTLEFNKGQKVAVPGTPYYYLTKLGRLELNGIPQITYDPLYCSNNHNNLVPGIFKPTLTTRAQFEAGTNSGTYSTDTNDMYGDIVNNDSIVNYGNGAKKFVTQDKLALSPIFSSKDFTCCTPLGKTTTSADRCCSNHAKNINGKLTCKLPTGTDLNVYFNKFVSSEGVGADQPGGEGLIVNDDDEEKIDFIALTGEPKLRDTTFDKLKLLGEAYCDKGAVTTGGAFGKFPPEPFAGAYNTPPSGLPSGLTLEQTFPISIVDSIVDSQADDPTVGKFPFDNGYRWNHHFYCK